MSGDNLNAVTTMPLERVEIDHIKLDVNILDEDGKTLLGKPHLTVLVDHYSYMVMGVFISMEYPSATAVRVFCLHAFTNKNDCLRKNGIDGYWPAQGVPDMLVCHNVREFMLEDFDEIANLMGVSVQYSPITHPHYKSGVDRFFGQLKYRIFENALGVQRKDGKSDEAYVGIKEVPLMLSEFKSLLLNWIIGVYHNLPIESRKAETPNTLWKTKRSADEALPMKESELDDELSLAVILMRESQRFLTPKGVQVNALIYNSKALQEIFLREGQKPVTVKINDFDLGHILVADKENRYVRVCATDFAYADGLTLYSHKLNKEKAQKELC